MVIMFLLAATTGLGATSAVYAATATIVDAEHRIRLERLTPRTSSAAYWSSVRLNLMEQHPPSSSVLI